MSTNLIHKFRVQLTVDGWSVVTNDTHKVIASVDTKEEADSICARMNKHPKPPEQAMRFNEGKPQLNYILSCDIAMTGLANVMEFGAKKYAKDNWKKGLDPDEIMDSLLRHLMAYRTGEVLDPESELPHVDHVMFNAIALATFGERVETS